MENREDRIKTRGTFKLSLAYASHLGALIKAVSITDGDVLELGTGPFSTPVLHHMCVPAKRKLVSYDNWDEWIDWCKHYKYEGKYHQLIYVRKWEDANLERPWDVALVDHSPSERRVEDIKRLAGYAKYIIIHDTDGKNKEYRYPEIYPLFKYRSDLVEDSTTVLSNLVDLKDFK